MCTRASLQLKLGGSPPRLCHEIDEMGGDNKRHKVMECSDPGTRAFFFDVVETTILSINRPKQPHDWFDKERGH